MHPMHPHKIWVHKSKSFADAEKFEEKYYLDMTAEERLDIMQYLGELYLKFKGGSNARGKRFRRVIKIIQ